MTILELQEKLKKLQAEKAALITEIKEVERAIEQVRVQQLLQDIQNNN